MPPRRRSTEHVVGPLGLGLEEAAAGIYDVVNVTMATGVRDVSVRRGYDPRDFPLVVAGGAGPVHAAAIAAELEIPLLVVPRESSIFCAAGMLMSDFKHDFVRSYKTSLDAIDRDRLEALLAEMEEQGRAVLARERVEADRIAVRRSLDLRYLGQWHELPVPLEAIDVERIGAAFHDQHDRLFGYASPEMPIEVLAARVTLVGSTTKPEPTPFEGGVGEADAARTGSRPVWSPAVRAMRETPVYDGLALAAGASLDGPAIVELANTTIVVLDDFHLSVDRLGAFVVAENTRGRELAAEIVEAGWTA